MSNQDGQRGAEAPALDVTICRATAEALERAGVGLIVTDRSGKVQYVNELAESQASGSLFGVENGYLKLPEVAATDRLHRRIWEVAGAHSPSKKDFEVHWCAGERGASAVVAPVQAVPDGERRLAMVLIPIAPPDSGASQERKGFNLTRSEARLLSALTDGQRIRDYAQQAGIAPTTVKSHLRSLFDKTGERRQADLIRRAMIDPQLRRELGRGSIIEAG